MTDAVKPATEKPANSAAGTDATKEQKAAAAGAHERLVADAAAPDSAKKADALAPAAEKKTDGAALAPAAEKKIDGAVATPPVEKTWAEKALEEVRNSSVASWMGIKPPDKSDVLPKVEVAAQTKAENTGFLDFSTTIPGYDANKSTPVTFSTADLKLDTKFTTADPATDGGGTTSWFSSAWDSTKQTFSDGYKWTTDTVSKLGDWSVATFDSAFEQYGKLSGQEYIKSLDGKPDYKVSTFAGPDDTLTKILFDYNDGSSSTITDKLIMKKSGATESFYNQDTKEARLVNEKYGTWDRLSDGTQIITQKDGTKVIYRGKDQVDIISKAADGSDVFQRVDKKNVYQEFGLFRTGDYVGTVWTKLSDLNKQPHMGKHETVFSDTGAMVEGTNGVKLQVTKDQTAMIANPDGSGIELDMKNNRAVRKDNKGLTVESGSIEAILPAAKGVKFDRENRTISIEGSSTVFHYGESGKLTTISTDEQGKKLVRVMSADGSVQTQYKAADGEILAQNKVNHTDLDNMFVQQNVKGETVSTFNYNKHEFVAADGAFKFSESGTELFGGEVHVDRYSGDISYSDGTKLCNSSPGALQASEAAASSASVNATSVASQLSAKAGNPATISSGDLSQCYSAYGSISAALQQCLASGNFAGVGQCLSAQGALASAIAVIAPKLNAMDDARRAGLSENAANRVGQGVGQGGGMSPYEAIQQIWRRQNGLERVPNS
jgi:hypothetical protein